METDLRADEYTPYKFISELSQFGDGNFLPLHDMTATITHRNSDRASVTLASGVHITEEAAIGLIPREIIAGSFMLQAGNRVGREDSHNHVFFGRLLLSDRANRSAEVAVAVKPVEKLHDAIGELAMFQYMRNLGLPTFEPVACIAGGAGRQNYLLTGMNKSVYTMDTVEWEKCTTTEKWEQLQCAVNTLVLLHSHMIIQGDPEFKNDAFDETGRVFLVDPEYSFSLKAVADDILSNRLDDNERTRALNLIQRKLGIDFTDVCKSIKTFIFGSMPPAERPANDLAKFEAYNTYLFEPYAKAMIDYDSCYAPIILTAFRQMVEHRYKLALNNML